MFVGLLLGDKRDMVFLWKHVIGVKVDLRTVMGAVGFYRGRRRTTVNVGDWRCQKNRGVQSRNMIWRLIRKQDGIDLVVGNIGDSRAILTTFHEDNTVHLKQSIQERICKCKCRIFALRECRLCYDPHGLGLAMGDFCLKVFGVIQA